jgi:outer membrane protein OmpA-like peptidoglycan-associated protein
MIHHANERFMPHFYRLAICLFCSLTLINCQTVDRAFFGDEAYQTGRDMKLSDVPDRPAERDDKRLQDLQSRLEADRAEGERLKTASDSELIPNRVTDPRMEVSELEEAPDKVDEATNEKQDHQQADKNKATDDELERRFADLSQNRDIQIIGRMESPAAYRTNNLQIVPSSRQSTARRAEPAARHSNGSVTVYSIDQAMPTPSRRGADRPSVNYFGLTPPTNAQRERVMPRRTGQRGNQFARLDPMTSPTDLPSGSNTPIARVLFGHGSASLDEEDRRIIDQLITQSKQNGRVIGIIGHASARAETDDEKQRRLLNLRMSGNRAASVFDYVTKAGVPVESIELGTHGDTLATFGQVEGEDEARRVDLYLY